jgi:hypothetical protein
MNLNYIVLTYMQTPGRWCITMCFDTGDEFTCPVRDGNPEEFIKQRFLPGMELKIHDWRTKTWRDGIEQA